MIIRAFIIFLMLVSKNFCNNKNEKLLIRSLLKDYAPSARPVLNVSKLQILIRLFFINFLQISSAVDVTFAATLQSIQQFNESAGTLTTNLWLNLEWKDDNLSWWASDEFKVCALLDVIAKLS